MTPLHKRIAALEQHILPDDNRITAIEHIFVEPILSQDGKHARCPAGSCKSRILESKIIPISEKGISA